MSDNFGSGFPRWSPSQVAATLVERRLGQVTADWRRSCVGDEVDADRVIRLVADALHDCGGNTARGHWHPSADALYEAERDRLRTLDPTQIACLREVLRRQVLLELEPAEALAALHCVSGVLDELQRKVAAWGVDRLERLAYADELTGLGNRRAASEATNAAVANAVRHGRPLVAAVLDVDHLKVVNDRDGHDAGDAVLAGLADALRTGLREGDTAYRTGGDEFLVLLPETGRADAEAVLGRVREAGAPSFSYGTAEAPLEAEAAEQLLRIADQRLLHGRRAARAPEVAKLPPPAAHRRGTLAGAGAVVTALALGLAAWTVISPVRGSALPGVFGIGLFVALVVAASMPEKPGRSPLAAAALAPLMGLAAANVAAPLLDAEVRPSQRMGTVGEALTASSATQGRPAVAEVVPTGTTVAARVEPPTVTPAPPYVAPPDVVTPPPPAEPPADTVPAPSTTTTPTTSTPSTTSTTSTTAPPETTTSTTQPSSTTSTSAPPRASNGNSTGRATVVDDVIITPHRDVDIAVLANDSGGESPLDPTTLTIVRRPTSGTVTVRPDGVVFFRGGDETTVQFQYEVCSVNRSCGRAWVTVDRREADAEPDAEADTDADADADR